MKDGFQTEVLENGMTLEAFYKDGLKHGKEVYKFASGSIASEANYLKGLLQGKLTEWDENGQLASEIMMNEGRPKGKYIIYKNGIKAKEGIANYSKVDSPSCSCC